MSSRVNSMNVDAARPDRRNQRKRAANDDAGAAAERKDPSPAAQSEVAVVQEKKAKLPKGHYKRKAEELEAQLEELRQRLREVQEVKEESEPEQPAEEAEVEDAVEESLPSPPSSPIPSDHEDVDSFADDLQHSFLIPGASAAKAPKAESDHRPKQHEALQYRHRLQVAKELPHWEKDSVSYHFLRTLKTHLDGSGLHESEWVGFLPLLFNRTDMEKAAWVRTNIVNVTKSWNEACKLFNEHFQDADYRVQLTNEYRKMRQRSNETGQEYTDRHLLLCEQLGIADGDKQAIRQFTESLLPAARSDYFTLLKARIGAKVKDNADLESLRGVMKLIVTLDVHNRTFQSMASDSTAHDSQFKRHVPALSAGRHGDKPRDLNKFKDERKTSGREPKKCVYHPESTTHATDECRLNPKNSASRTPGISPHRARPAAGGDARSTPSVDAANVTCFGCGEKGHFANDIKCPKYKDRRDQRQGPAPRPRFNSNSFDGRPRVSALGQRPRHGRRQTANPLRNVDGQPPADGARSTSA
jgi:hypothetical protein